MVISHNNLHVGKTDSNTMHAHITNKAFDSKKQYRTKRTIYQYSSYMSFSGNAVPEEITSIKLIIYKFLWYYTIHIEIPDLERVLGHVTGVQIENKPLLYTTKFTLTNFICQMPSRPCEFEIFNQFILKKISNLHVEKTFGT